MSIRFAKDGYKLIEVPYTGMEHQSAVTYGNGFPNGYVGRDWTGVGVSPKFDFIIIHESGHEWFGNAVSAADVSDMWIQEGWSHVPRRHVRRAAVRLRGRAQVRERLQVEGRRTARRSSRTRGIHARRRRTVFQGRARSSTPSAASINDDAKWWALVRGVYDTFKYRNIMTEDMVRFFNERTGRN